MTSNSKSSAIVTRLRKNRVKMTSSPLQKDPIFPIEVTDCRVTKPQYEWSDNSHTYRSRGKKYIQDNSQTKPSHGEKVIQVY